MVSFTQVLYIGVLLIFSAEGIVNLARLGSYMGNASQSSTYPDHPWTADKAVDGQLQGSDENSCSFTRGYFSKTAWWKLPLLLYSNIAYLEIYFRNGTVNRHTGFSVFVFNETLIDESPSVQGLEVFAQDPSSCPSRIMNITINKVTKGVGLYNSKDPPLQTTCAGYVKYYATIEICEVKVMGCGSQHYGEPCKLCPTKCFNRECNAFDGSCIYGCSDRFVGPPDCVQCKGGFYGHDCAYMCGKCKTGTLCNTITGICPNGCQNRWSGLKCDMCENGFYGDSCTTTCGHCKPRTYCHHETGDCQEGCDDHWDGSKCDVCENGFYGDNCTQSCGHCKVGTYCQRVTGICQEGCDDPWDGSKCNVCKRGFYGTSCENICGRCKDETHCNNITGICADGCQSQWNGAKCDECKDYKYGPNCVFDCGHCKDGKPCRKTNGACVEGCDVGWTGIVCLKVSSSTGDLQADDGIPKTSSVIISIVSTLLVVILLCVGVKIVLNKRKRGNTQRREDQRDDMPTKCVGNPQFYNQIAETNDEHTYNEINPSPKDFDDQEMHVYKNTEFC